MRQTISRDWGEIVYLANSVNPSCWLGNDNVRSRNMAERTQCTMLSLRLDSSAGEAMLRNRSAYDRSIGGGTIWIQAVTTPMRHQ
jgi:hypothetical protein